MRPGADGFGRQTRCRAAIRLVPQAPAWSFRRREEACPAPLLVIENSADEACPASDPGKIYAAAASKDKTRKVIKGARHYYQGQPELLKEATDSCLDWLRARNLLD